MEQLYEVVASSAYAKAFVVGVYADAEIARQMLQRFHRAYWPDQVFDLRIQASSSSAPGS